MVSEALPMPVVKQAVMDSTDGTSLSFVLLMVTAAGLLLLIVAAMLLAIYVLKTQSHTIWKAPVESTASHMSSLVSVLKMKSWLSCKQQADDDGGAPADPSKDVLLSVPIQDSSAQYASSSTQPVSLTNASSAAAGVDALEPMQQPSIRTTKDEHDALSLDAAITSTSQLTLEKMKPKLSEEQHLLSLEAPPVDVTPESRSGDDSKVTSGDSLKAPTSVGDVPQSILSVLQLKPASTDSTADDTGECH